MVMAWLRRAVTPMRNEVQVTAEGSTTVHTLENPYCQELSCWCHTNVEYHGQVTGFSVEVDETLFAFAMATLKGS